ncbi:hypothetical protein G3480_24370 [Thiorhodococcus mannitoliphagus]|uniref:Uncharacterized protein n=1 Tax=Thiorhodococcus mannitoliphagus TaxID=329406 RepID=A0A6P1E0R7_9GAMM|nr:hypothetical protein [Thiorhodococcus mannitoliphagus]NEX23390.1 hypothetical protein [Thiorhodococcus mannitoliphagus]
MPRQHENLSSRELLAQIGLSEEDRTDLLDDEPLEDLREHYQALTRRHDFAPSDLVTWKPGLRNHRVPRYQQPVVVIEVLPESIHDQDREAGSTYFREPLDLVLGLIGDEDPGRGELVTFHFDSRRFQPWTEEHNA